MVEVAGLTVNGRRRLAAIPRRDAEALDSAPLRTWPASTL